MTVPRFDYEGHLAALTGDSPRWPLSTRAVSELRLSFRVQPRGMLGALSGPRTLHLDIVDYPGEWLLDLALMDMGYAEWSADVLARIAGRSEAENYLRLVAQTDGAAPLQEPQAQALATAWLAYLKAARDAGFSDCTPGRFLLPGDLEGSPVLTFAPLPRGAARRGSLRAAMMPIAARLCARSFATISRGSTGRWCWPMCWGRFTRARRRSRICAAPWPGRWRRSGRGALAGWGGFCRCGGSRRYFSPRPRPITCTTASMAG
jgi:hypothetical protein